MTDLITLQYETRSRVVSDLLHLYQQGRLNLSPGFQRKSVWTIRHRQRLIDSMLRRYPLPAVFLYKREHDGRDVFDVIDGKQRIESILMFIGEMRGRFEVKVQLPGADSLEWIDWNILRRRKQQNRIESYELPVIIVGGDLSEIIELFVRINSTGMALTRQEKAHAKFFNSPFLKEAGKLAKRFESYFMRMGVLGEGQIGRMKHVELVCELMLSIQKADVLNKKAALDRVMAADGIDGRSLGKATRATVTALNRVKCMFPKLSETRFAQLADFYSLVVLIAKFEGERLVLTDRKRNRLAWDLLQAFSNRVDELRERQRKAQSLAPEQEIYREYLLTVTQATDEINQRRTRERILRQILESLFAVKDAQRGFTPEQRRVMWNTAKSHRCGGCNAVLSWGNFTIDHIDPYSKGGRSQLENATLLCQPCNSAKGSKRRRRG